MNDTDNLTLEFGFRPLYEGFKQSQIKQIRRLSETYPTGLTWFDQWQDDGLHPGLYILSGDHSSGKTSLALQLATGLIRNTQLPHDTASPASVLYFTTETITVNVLLRCMIQTLNAPNAHDAEYGTDQPWPLTCRIHDLEQNSDSAKILRQTCWQRFKTAGISDRMYVIDHSQTVASIRSYVMKHMQLTGTERLCVIVDCLQCVRPDPSARWHDDLDIRLIDIVRDLAQLSEELWIPILATSNVSHDDICRHYRLADKVLRLEPDEPREPRPDTFFMDEQTIMQHAVRPRRIALRCIKDYYQLIYNIYDYQEPHRYRKTLYYYPAHGWFLPCNGPAD